MSWLFPIYETKLNLKVCEGVSVSTKCRYFATDDNKPCCLKLNPEYKMLIDEEVEYFLSQRNAKIGVVNGIYRLGENVPLGDNCPGVRMENDIE